MKRGMDWKALKRRSVRLNRWICGLSDLDKKRLREVSELVYYRGWMAGIAVGSKRRLKRPLVEADVR